MMGRTPSIRLLSSSALLLQVAFGQLNNETSPTYQFKSRPDLHAPILEIDLLRPELVAPGYIFVAPYRNVDPGPYIYDNFGELVWSGAGSSGPKTAHAPHTCIYNGEEHLCYFQGEQHQGFARGHGVIMDKHYRIVKTVESAGAGASSDMHEFRLTPYSGGKTALMTVYQPRMFDLTSNPMYKIKGGMGWIVEGVFQEIEIETGKVIFEWRSTDHLDPSLSYTMPGTTDTSGNGLTENTPWDYFHINSIDKNEAGDYLISARHMAGIYKLSGKDGHIMWELGGANPSFHQTNFNFSSQHHARWVSENATHTVLTFYDNASNGVNITDKFSRGYFISIDHANQSATAFKAYDAPEPEGGLLSGSQGNIQLLPNGNVHLGWGEHAYFSEHTADGSAVMYAKVAQRASNVMIYRSYKFPWVGEPQTKPALWTYSRNGDETSGMVFYVSWNGATEVESWNFYAAENASGPFELVGNSKKAGFETVMRYMNVTGWSFAEALDKKGNALDRSVISKTFVPGATLREHCTDWTCGTAEHDQEADNEQIEFLETKPEYKSNNRGYNTAAYYAVLDKVRSQIEVAAEAQETFSAGSLILIIGAGATLFVAVIAAFMARRHVAAGVLPLYETMERRASEVRQACASSRFLGKYVRVDGTEKD
ncbi:ASST-domain-containing protein [Delphinella strobiligena]|nr:ASST-domain-containing protein [Delphinella strobiligena]